MSRAGGVPALLLLAALGAGPMFADGGLAPGRDVPARLAPVPVARGGNVPFVLLRRSPGEPGRPLPLLRATVRNGELAVEPAGWLPARTLAVELLPPAGADPPACLVSRPGEIGLLAARRDGTFHPEDLVPLVEDPRLAATRLLHPDLDGDGTGDLVVESWAGALLLRRAGTRRRVPLGWLPLPRSATISAGAVHVRARPLVPPVDGARPPRLWAATGSEGGYARFRGAPVADVRPDPAGGGPSLEARVRLPAGSGAATASLLLPGSPDRVARVEVRTGWLGPRGRPRLLVLPLLPRHDGLPPPPDLEAALPLDPHHVLLGSSDADGDGTLDLLAAGVSRRAGRTVEVALFRGLGGGRFAPRPLSFRGRAGRDPRVLALRDLDGDGRPDLLAAGRGLVAWWRGRATTPGELPWKDHPDASWKVPGRDSVPGPVETLSAAPGRWLILGYQLPGGNATRLLALLLP